MSLLHFLGSIPVNANLRTQVGALEKRLSETLAQNVALENQIVQLNDKLRIAEARILELEQDIERIQSAENGVNAIQQRSERLNYDPYENLK